MLELYKEDIIKSFTNGETSTSISERYGCSSSSIIRFLRKNNIYKKAFDYRRLSLINNEYSILEGLLLGDGSLNCNKGASYFQIACKYLEYIEYLRDNLSFLNNRKIYHYPNRGKFGMHTINSLSYPDFRNIYSLWYNDMKIIPKALILNETNTLHWYLGDGSLSTTKRYITLHTNGYKKEDVEFLIYRLYHDLNIISTLKKQNKPIKFGDGYCIYIGASQFQEFLLKLDCPVSCFKYKWI